MGSFPSFPTLLLGGIVWYLATMAIGILLDLPLMKESRRWLARPGMKLLALVVGVTPALAMIGQWPQKLLQSVGFGSWIFGTFGFWIGTPILAGLSGSWLALSHSYNPRARMSSAIAISLVIWLGNVFLVAWR